MDNYNIEIFSIEDILMEWGSCEDYLLDKNDRPIPLGIPLGQTCWSQLLDRKRGHACYQKILKEIESNGFLMPLFYLEQNSIKIHCDGHHRLAIAIDLGYKYLPYLNHANTNKLLRLKDFKAINFFYKNPQ